MDPNQHIHSSQLPGPSSAAVATLSPVAPKRNIARSSSAKAALDAQSGWSLVGFAKDQLKKGWVFGGGLRFMIFLEA